MSPVLPTRPAAGFDQRAPLAMKPEMNLDLANYQESVDCLSDVMKRVHTQLTVPEFIEAVAVTFQEVRNDEPQDVMQRRFRAAGSFPMFQKALRLSLRARGEAQSILVMGCGRGFAGEPADFAAHVVNEIFLSKRTSVATCNLSSAFLRQDPERLFSISPFAGQHGSFDLVVTHSLLHYIPDLTAAFTLIRRLLKPSGGLILSHEPNSRFWKDDACQETVRALGKEVRAGQWRRRFSVNRLYRLFRATTGRTERISDRVNRKLMERYVLTGSLAENEIQRLVDIHRPEAVPGTFRIGLNGFDPQDLTQTYLPGFRLIWVGSSDHLGYASSASLSPKWQRREQTLAASRPLAGCVFTAYWSQDPAAL